MSKNAVCSPIFYQKSLISSIDETIQKPLTWLALRHYGQDMIDSIFEKYRIPESYSKNPLGTLFFILRKAELAKNLSHNDFDYLESLGLSEVISLIKSQEENRKVIEEYRTAIASALREDLAVGQIETGNYIVAVYAVLCRYFSKGGSYLCRDPCF